MIRKINNSKIAIYILLIGTFIIMLALNYMTMMLVDDYTYSFSFVDCITRISSPLQIIPSMQAHYESMNGRLIAHGLVQFMLLLSPLIFDVLNAGFFCLLCNTIYYYVWKNKHSDNNGLIFLLIIATVWVFTPAFGQVFLWLDGSVNYLWTLTVLLLYLKPVVTGWKGSPFFFWGGYLPLGFIMGALSETVSFATMSFFLLWGLYYIIIEKKKFRIQMILPIFTMFPSYYLMVRSPGTHNNKIGNDLKLGESLIRAINQYSSWLKWLLFIWVILTIVIVSLFGLQKEILQSCIWLVGSLGMNIMHGITRSYPERSMTGATVFLIIAIGILFSDIVKNNIHEDLPSGTNTTICTLLINTFAALVMTEAVVLFLPGAYDVYSSWQQMRQNEKYIIEEVANGRKDIEVYDIYVTTRYSAAYGLKYVDTRSPDNRPNIPMALYYGANQIVGLKGR